LNYTSVRVVVPLTVNAKLPPLITWPAPSVITYGAALGATQLNATASIPGTFVYTPSAGIVLAPGRYTLTALFTPTDTEKYATAQAAVVLEVEEMLDIAALTTAPAEQAAVRASKAIKPTSASPAPTNGMGEHAAARTAPRETRTYKGAVYEKGDDGQWHLQKK
jgi:hypothetical protein